ncbi:Acg family FMN-binding oxidoreductase [Actinoplanes solisilvae]|uniref:Acg family FMN-binding oxidoreductase n=1 Tax=Actinoplanes solisilvae TaxID=2486853 RepID=UPI000FDBA32A|nr:nitroreductase [Actinoplanes solisilvae]
MNGYDDADLRAAAAAGIRAPSMHNSQPWRFRLHEGNIEVLADAARQLEIADRSGWAIRLAAGAATYNARLALAVRGRPAEVWLRPVAAEPGILAQLVRGSDRPPTTAERDLLAAVPHRHSNRAPFRPDPVPADTRIRLIQAARDEGAWLDLLVGTTALTAFSEIAGSADRVLRRNTAYQTELAAWTHADQAPDGIPVRAGAPPPKPYDLLPQRFLGDQGRADGLDYEPEPLVGILGVSGDLPIDHLTAGQALQKVLLTATDAGLAASMMSQPIEVTAARDQLRRSLGRSGFPQMTLRIGYGEPAGSAPRRSVDEVMAHRDEVRQS